MSTQEKTATTQSETTTAKSWLKKIGIAGFMFFLIKGLVWIGVFVAAFFGWKGC